MLLLSLVHALSVGCTMCFSHRDKADNYYFCFEVRGEKVFVASLRALFLILHNTSSSACLSKILQYK